MLHSVLNIIGSIIIIVILNHINKRKSIDKAYKIIDTRGVNRNIRNIKLRSRNFLSSIILLSLYFILFPDSIRLTQ